MIRVVLVALATALAVPGTASALTQLQLLAQMELREHGFGEVDVTKLTTGQLAAIRGVANQSGQRSGKRLMIRSVLGGPNTLRSLFF